jgi:hypothetical protein
MRLRQHRPQLNSAVALLHLLQAIPTNRMHCNHVPMPRFFNLAASCALWFAEHMNCSQLAFCRFASSTQTCNLNPKPQLLFQPLTSTHLACTCSPLGPLAAQHAPRCQLLTWLQPAAAAPRGRGASAQAPSAGHPALIRCRGPHGCSRRRKGKVL